MTLKSRTTAPAAPVNSILEIRFTYDAMGRRIRKHVTSLDTGSVLKDEVLMYDGWNLVAVYNKGVSTTMLGKSFLWGIDGSGSLAGAGGVGGLLMIRDHVVPTRCFAASDANGNVVGLVDADAGTPSAVYEYGPFGELIRISGPMAKSNPFRFST